MRSLIEICITEKMPMPPTSSEMPAIEASTIVPVGDQLVDLLAHAQDLLADVLDLEVGDAAVAAAHQRLGLLLGVVHLLGVGLEGPGVDRVGADEVLLRGRERDVDLGVVALHLVVVHLAGAEAACSTPTIRKRTPRIRISRPSASSSPKTSFLIFWPRRATVARVSTSLSTM